VLLVGFLRFRLGNLLLLFLWLFFFLDFFAQLGFVFSLYTFNLSFISRIFRIAAVARFSAISTESRLMGFADLLLLGGFFNSCHFLSGLRFHGSLVVIVHLNVVFGLVLDRRNNFFFNYWRLRLELDLFFFSNSLDLSFNNGSNLRGGWFFGWSFLFGSSCFGGCGGFLG